MADSGGHVDSRTKRWRSATSCRAELLGLDLDTDPDEVHLDDAPQSLHHARCLLRITSCITVAPVILRIPD